MQRMMTFLISITFLTTFLLRILFLDSNIDVSFCPRQFHEYIGMIIVLRAIQMVFLTLTLQLAIQWI